MFKNLRLDFFMIYFLVLIILSFVMDVDYILSVVIAIIAGVSYLFLTNQISSKEEAHNRQISNGLSKKEQRFFDHSAKIKEDTKTQPTLPGQQKDTKKLQTVVRKISNR